VRRRITVSCLNHVSLSFLVVVCSAGNALAENFEGVFHTTASTVIQSGVNNQATIILEGKNWIKESKMRTETVVEKMTIVNIIDADAHQSISLVPGKETAIVVPWEPKDKKKLREIFRTGKTDVILGRPVEQFIAKIEGGQEIELWATSDLNISRAVLQAYSRWLPQGEEGLRIEFVQSGYFSLRTVEKDANGSVKVRMDVTKIEKMPLDADLFAVPSNYQLSNRVTTGKLGTSGPPKAEAKIEPAIYSQFDLRLEINQRLYDITFNSHCYKNIEGVNKGSGRWVIRPEGGLAVVKKMGDDSVVFFEANGACGDNVPRSKEYLPTIGLMRSVTDALKIEIYTHRRNIGNGTTVNVKSGIVRVLNEVVPDYEHSEEEKRLMEVLKNKSHGYQSVSARIIPESIWQKSEGLSKYFENATGILTAPVPANLRSDIVGRDGKNNFFPVDQSGAFRGVEYDLYTIPLRKDGPVWRLNAADSSQSALAFYALPPTEDGRGYTIGNPPPAVVDYDGVLINVLSSQQIYDSKKRLLIQFVNNYQALPFQALDFVSR
jgi:hypothetical protein